MAANALLPPPLSFLFVPSILISLSVFESSYTTNRANMLCATADSQTLTLTYPAT
ncbi:hypothetical protein K491DRAFT_695340 [Lophiostoma macrostomum CBS 122681]|uniref:Uncharacterized protein n=1 Tax=Lophiostoma macrostomum CBS 122681 TaxID=1314788 RepID=A0A6A6T1I5_9PLEO|nr:hypothetical protein K491DRAFT_695340 [Lophiostoma macrostomum CBS 122681]